MKRNILFLLSLITFFDAFSQNAPTIIMSKEGKGTLEFRIALKSPGTVSVDWGNNKLKTYEAGASAKISEATVISGKIAENAVIKVYAEDLVYLYCREQSLSTLDLTNARDIKVVDCAINSLTAIDFSNNPELNYLNCHKNNILSLDLTNNRKLKTLNCSFNNLQMLNLSENRVLDHLSFFENKISTVTLSTPNMVSNILGNKNKLTAINLKDSKSLIYVDVAANLFDSCSLNKLFSELPINKKTSDSPNLKINHNSGAGNSNTNIAIDKRWVLDRTGKGTAVCN